MPGGFSNPIVGGGGALVYPSVHSPNYVTGVSGWTINKDGSAEFNSGIFRSTLAAGVMIVNASGTFVYGTSGPAANNLQFSAAPIGGTDAYGNQYLAGVVAYQPGATAYAMTFNVQVIQLYQSTANETGAGWVSQGFIEWTVSGGWNFQNVAGSTAATFAGEVVAQGSTANPVLRVTTTQATPPNMVQIEAPAAANNAFAAGVSGDTNMRLKINSNGKMLWGPGGGSGQDTDLYRLAANILATDDVLALGGIAAPSAQAGFALLYGDTSDRPAVTEPSGAARVLDRSQASASQFTLGNVGTAGSIGPAWSVPANDAIAAAIYEVEIWGEFTYSATLNESLQFGLSIAGSTMSAAVTVPAAQFSTGASVNFNAKWVVQCTTAGSSGSVHANLVFSSSQRAASTAFTGVGDTPSGAAFNTTVANSLTPQGQWGGAGGAAQLLTTYGSRFTRRS